MFENSLRPSKRNEEAPQELKRGETLFEGYFKRLAVLALLFVVAIVAAANNYSLLGWSVVVLIALWLVMATGTFLFALRMIALRRSSEARAAAAQACPGPAQCGFAGLSVAEANGAVVGFKGENKPIREEKLRHNFKVIQAQSQILLEDLSQSPDRARQAAQTINEVAVQGEELMEGQGGA